MNSKGRPVAYYRGYSFCTVGAGRFAAKGRIAVYQGDRLCGLVADLGEAVKLVDAVKGAPGLYAEVAS